MQKFKIKVKQIKRIELKETIMNQKKMKMNIDLKKIKIINSLLRNNSKCKRSLNKIKIWKGRVSH